MKSIKRYAKFDRKFEQDSDTSSDKQGTYYQFLVEKKVPNGTLRHIASLINVTYEFIPDNYQTKRQKFEEDQLANYNINQEMKENNSLLANTNDNIINEDLNALQNIELKMLEDKSVDKEEAKDSKIMRKGNLFYESLPFRGSD